jgi:tRNA G18 (ribose-2'-O)-methylase SpoU
VNARRIAKLDALRRGYCGIGIVNGKTPPNLGTLWRSADLLGADFVFTVGSRYKPQNSDTLKSWRHMPLWRFDTMPELHRALPLECPLVAVELTDTAVPLEAFDHPLRACYLLGAEDNGLTREALSLCHYVVQLPGRWSMNVAAAGSIVLYDRMAKRDAHSATLEAAE